MHAFVVPLQVSSIREFGEAVCAGIHFAKIKQFNFSEALRCGKLSKWGVNNNADKVGELVEVCRQAVTRQATCHAILRENFPAKYR